MPLSLSVGTRGWNGPQCDNLARDQQTVFLLLNLISLADGGMQGLLKSRIIPGIASEALCNAIHRFDDMQSLREDEWFVRPDSRKLKRMEELASRNTAAPWAATIPPPPAPTSLPKPVRLQGLFTATFTLDLVWEVSVLRPVERNAGTLTLPTSFQALPDATRHSYSVADWLSGGPWTWQPSPSIPEKLPTDWNRLRDGRTVLLPAGMGVSVPAAWRQPLVGSFHVVKRNPPFCDMRHILGDKWVATMRDVRADLIIRQEEGRRAFEKNPELRREACRVRDPSCSAMAASEGSCELTMADDDETQGFTWWFGELKD
jgi:hypothetical protein